MQIIIVLTLLVVSLSCLTANLFVAYMLWQHWQDKHEKSNVEEQPEESPEEKEARRIAARAQAAYDQGFIDLMNFSGRAPKGE